MACGTSWHKYDNLVEHALLLAAEGVTACLPTVLGSPPENMAAMRPSLVETDDFRLISNLFGFRPEITYLAKTGAGAAESLAKISAETTELPRLMRRHGLCAASYNCTVWPVRAD